MKSELGAVAIAGVVMGAALLGPATSAGAAPQPPVASKHALALGAVNIGWIQSVEGGGATSEVVTEKVGPDHVVHKHIAGVKYEDISIASGTGMSPGFYDWIQESLTPRRQRRDGTVTSVDTDLKIVRTIEFKQALITAVGFPAIDAAAKDAQKISLAFSPEHTRNVPKTGGAAKIAPSSVPAPTTSAPMTFRFDYVGCGAACKSAVKLAPVYVKVITPAGAGLPPPQLKTSNIIVTIPPPPDLMKWVADGTPRDGTLEYVTGDGSVAVAFRMSKMKPVRVTVQQSNKQPFVELELAPQEIVSPR